MSRSKTVAFYLLLAVLMAFTPGCASNRGTIKAGDARVQSVSNPGKAATLNTSTQTGSLHLPQNSKIIRTEIDAQPAKEATATAPAKAAEPAKVITEVQTSAPTEWVETKQTVNADTGVIDTSVAKHQIDAQDRKWLLFAAIGCGIAGIVLKSMLPAWPALSNGLLIAAPIAFAAWKISEVPPWLWMTVIGVVGLLALGYKRAEWDKDHDGIPDFLEKKTT